jgi:hypothetical protein
LEQQVFKERPITEAAPTTFPRSPDGNVCVHSNKVFVKGKAGHNCSDCGFFIPISQQKPKIESETIPAHVAEFHEPEKLKVGSIPSNYNIIELPRASFDVGGEDFFKEEGFLGEVDKKKINIFNGLLKDGFKIKSLGLTQANTYLFLLEK